MRYLRLASAVFLLLVLMSANSAAACICGPKPSVKDSIDTSDFVFSGRVVSREYAQIPVTENELWDGTAFTFVVDRVWKGMSAARLVVASGSGGGDCGYHFETGQSYIVYGYEEDGKRYTNICTRTAPLAQAAVDLSTLPEPKTAFVYVAKFNWISLSAAGLGGFLTALCLCWFLLRRRTKSAGLAS